MPQRDYAACFFAVNILCYLRDIATVLQHKNTTGKGLWYFTVFNYFQGKLIMPMM